MPDNATTEFQRNESALNNMSPPFLTFIFMAQQMSSAKEQALLWGNLCCVTGAASDGDAMFNHLQASEMWREQGLEGRQEFPLRRPGFIYLFISDLLPRWG